MFGWLRLGGSRTPTKKADVAFPRVIVSAEDEEIVAYVEWPSDVQTMTAEKQADFADHLAYVIGLIGHNKPNVLEMLKAAVVCHIRDTAHFGFGGEVMKRIQEQPDPLDGYRPVVPANHVFTANREDK